MATDRRFDSLGQDDLAAVGGRFDTRCPVYGRSEIVTTALIARSGMESHPNPQPHGFRPLGFVQTTLDLDRHGQRVHRLLKSGAERVPNRLEDIATVILNARTK
jgi:hypothetical protein